MLKLIYTSFTMITVNLLHSANRYLTYMCDPLNQALLGRYFGGLHIYGNVDWIYHARLNSRLDTQTVSSNSPRSAMKLMVFPWPSVTVGEVDTLDVDQ